MLFLDSALICSSPIFRLSFRQAAQAVMAGVGRSKLEVKCLSASTSNFDLPTAAMTACAACRKLSQKIGEEAEPKAEVDKFTKQHT